MVGLITGPGHHSQELISQLQRFSLPFLCSYYWPRFKLIQNNEKNEINKIAGSKLYDSSSYLLSVLWNKLNYPEKKRFHLDYLFPLYGKIASSYMKDCDTIIGWSQVSLEHLKKKKGRFILEHPMPHVDFWNQTIKEELSLNSYAKGQTLYSLRTSKMTNRMKKEYELADSINLLSNFAKQTFINKGIPESKLTVTPLGIDAKLYQSQVEKNDKFIVLYVGRLELWKGVHYLLESFSKLNLSNAELWLVGSIKPEIQPFLNKYKGSFRYLGIKSKTELISIYKQASVFVLPSLNEAFGLVILEAMASGVPVIATYNSAGPDIIDHGVDGFVVPPRNSIHIASCIETFYKNPDLLLSASIKARSKVLDKYNLNSYGDSLQKALNIKSS